MHTNPEEQFPRNSSPPPEIPPLPEMAGAMPPPLPKPQVVTTSGKKTVLMALGAMVVLLIGAVVAGVGLFWVTKRDLEVTPEHRAALHTAADLAEWYEFEVDPANSEITVLRRGEGRDSNAATDFRKDFWRRMKELGRSGRMAIWYPENFPP